MKLTSLLVILFLTICCEISVSNSASIREKRDVKNELIANANELLSNASSVVAELLLENRTQEAHTIESFVNTTNTLVQKLNATTNETEINELKALLVDNEEQLTAVIDFYELIITLLNSGEQIIKRANRQIDTLNQHNQTNFVLIFENELKLISDNLSELRNATLMSEVMISEFKLIRQLKRLEKVLYEIGVGWDVVVVKHRQLNKSAVLLQQLCAALNQLKIIETNTEQYRNQTIDNLERQFRVLTNLTEQLSNATDNNTIAELTFKVYELELQLEVEFAFLGLKTVSSQEVETMSRQIQELSTKVLVVQSKMVAIGGQLALKAQTFNNELRVLTDFETTIRNTVYPLDFLYYELRFMSFGYRVNKFLKKANELIMKAIITNY